MNQSSPLRLREAFDPARYSPCLASTECVISMVEKLEHNRRLGDREEKETRKEEERLREEKDELARKADDDKEEPEEKVRQEKEEREQNEEINRRERSEKESNKNSKQSCLDQCSVENVS